MAIKILNTNNNNNSGGGASEDGDIIGDLTTGHGMVPNYEDLGTYAIRSDDPEVTKAIAEAYPGVELEEFDGKRPFYAIFPEGQDLDIIVDFLRTEMVLRSRQMKKLRQCDGISMSDGGDCACAQNYEHGSQEFREAAKDGLACKPEGLIFFTLPGVDLKGKFVFSKSSESTVRPFAELEELVDELELKTFSVSVGIRNITSKKTGYSWNVPTFGTPEEA